MNKPADHGTEVCSAEVYACKPDYAQYALQCIGTQFESALTEHAAFSNLLGETLIPLASIIGYRATFKNGKNPKALLAGGLAMYGVGSYVYRQPREEIYLTGASALQCVQRRASALELNPTDRTELVSVKNDSTDPTAEPEKAWLVARGAHELAAKCLALDPNLIRMNAARLQALRGKLTELESRLDTARTTAERLLDADRRIHRQTCEVANQIRIDVNHLIAGQRADLGKLDDLLSKLKFPVPTPALPQQRNGGGGAAPDVVAAALAGMGVPGDPTKVQNLLIHCNTTTLLDAIPSTENALASQLDIAERAIAQIESRLPRTQVDTFDEQGALDDCGVSSVAKPMPLTIAPPDPIELIQAGPTRQVSVLGGNRPYHQLVPTPPVAGKLNAIIGGDGTIGYYLAVSADEKATPGGAYAVVVTDSAGSSQTITVKIAPKKD